MFQGAWRALAHILKNLEYDHIIVLPLFFIGTINRSDG